MRIGVIGAGKIGKLRVQSIKDDPTAELVAVLDINTDLAESAVEGTSGKAFSELEHFLETGMDAVIVSTPPHLHRNACVAAFARGCHVLCEKPLSNTVEGGQTIVDAAIAANCILAVGFNLRYYPCVKYARDAVDQGKIGRLEHVRVFGGHDGLHNFSADWQYKMPESGGGAMMDVGIHMTDLARYFLREVTTVYGIMSETVWNVEGSEDNAIAIFRNPDGISATYQATWSEWKGYKSCFEIYGDKGMVRGAYAPMQNLLISQGVSKGRKEKVRKLYPEIMLREKLRSWKSTALISFQEELRDFQKMMSGTTNVPLADGFAGLRSIEIANAVRDCTASGQPVELTYLGKMRS